MRLRALLLSLAVPACAQPSARRGDTSGAGGVSDTLTAIAAARGAGDDSGFRDVQSRGAGVMGVDQDTSVHVFESLADGGRIILERPSAADSSEIRTIRAHMRDIAAQFQRGDFRAPFLVHAQTVPGTVAMARLASAISYAPMDRPRGAELRISTQNPTALKAIHEFLAFQRADHRAAGHEGHTGHGTP
jgi:putative ubiquitin-RnfH superfamily antitoxin RatB of RatAB toxin-antitoxin module